MFSQRSPPRNAQETYTGKGLFLVQMPTNYINSASAGASGYVDGVWVARETTNDWAFSATAAGALRTKFTPLTLSIPNMNGVSLDFQSANNSLKIVNAAYLGTYRGTSLRAPLDTYLYNKGGVMLRGGHFVPS